MILFFVGQSKSKCVSIITFLSSRIDKSEVQTQQLNISNFNFTIIIKISAQVINKILKFRKFRK
jgi:hypothetical protein